MKTTTSNGRFGGHACIQYEIGCICDKRCRSQLKDFVPDCAAGHVCAMRSSREPGCSFIINIEKAPGILYLGTWACAKDFQAFCRQRLIQPWRLSSQYLLA